MAFLTPYSAEVALRERAEARHRAAYLHEVRRVLRRHGGSTSAPRDRISPEHPGEGRPRA